MIATYIQELLATNNRVIIPNFGAFLVRATSKNKDANTLDKKLKDIYFSPFLKFNDELLEKYIIKKENVSKEQATEKIKEFIETVKKELDNEKPFEIKDFGKFIIDKQGKVQFITVANEKDEESPKEEKKAAPTKAEEPKTKKSTAQKTASPKTKKDDEKAKKADQEPPKETKKESVKKTRLQEFTPEKEEPAKPEAPKTGSYRKEKQPLNKSVIWTVAIGVPIAVLLIFALINIDKIEAIFNKDKSKTKATTEIAQEKKSTSKEEKVAKTEEASKKQTADKKATVDTDKKTTTAAKQETKSAAPAQKKYYIIAGSFKNENYAERFLEDLKKQGYNAEKLGERNGMHAVSYNSFSDKRKALAEYRFLTQEKNLKAWILYY